MSLSYKLDKCLILLLFTILIHFFVMLKTTGVFAEEVLGQTSCPSTFLRAVLEEDMEGVRYLIKQGMDVNVSLEGCRGLGIEKFEEFLDTAPQIPEGQELLLSHTILTHHAIHPFYKVYISYLFEEQRIDTRSQCPVCRAIEAQ